MKKRTMKLTKLLALVLAVVMCVTILPALSGKADAETTYPYPKPNYNGVFRVYKKHFQYSPYTINGNTYVQHSIYGMYYPRLYMEYSANNGRTWKRSGYMHYDGITTADSIKYVIKGLKANTKYKTRIYYGDDYGNRQSPYRYTTTIKTGKSKAPKVKSVKVKAVNIKYHKEYVPGHYEFTAMGSPIWIRGLWRKYYTYKLRVTVRLKKKPGTGGLYINGKCVKGNKKKYVATFTPYPNVRLSRPPKGMKKYTVNIRSYQKKAYKGFSPNIKRKRKVR